MKILKANADNDLHLDHSGDLAMATGAEALAQLLEHKMQSLLGEMMYHTDKGLPYEQCVWNSAPNLRQFESYARQALHNTEGVKRVLRFNASKESNALLYETLIDTIYGELSFHGTA